MVQDEILKILKEAVFEVTGMQVKNLTLEHPTNEKWGDYSTNAAMVIAKDLKQPPVDIAKEISYRIREKNHKFSIGGSEYSLFDVVDFVPPGFINFKLSSKWLQNSLQNTLKQLANYGLPKHGNKKTILVEYSQPNPNKPQHIGHARNNFLGSSLSKILEFLGYKVIKSNYVGDIGIHICKSMLMYQKYGKNLGPNKKSDHFVGDFYIRFEKEVEKDSHLLEEAKEMLRKWEAKDPETMKLWKKMVNWAYDGWKKTYEDQRVEFDIWEYESGSVDAGKEIADYAVKVGVAEKDETGAIIARLEKYGIPDKVLLRSDGTSIYSTKDLQLAKDGFEKYHFEKRLYVVDHRQSDYFKQVFKILDILGFEWAKRLYHVSYGEVRLPEGPMSSRKGLVINADEVYEKLIELEIKELEKRESEIENRDEVIRQVALAAFKYPMLKVDSRQDIVFDYAYVTRFEGDTGPYLQYTHARACSVLRKSGQTLPQDLDLGQDLDPSGEEILRSLYRFPEVIVAAGENLAPNLICNYLFDVAQRFNSFYNEFSVLNAETEELKKFRLSLTLGVSKVLKDGLALLGIDAPERM